MWCFHKYGNIVDGYQYCKKCNKAESVKCNKAESVKCNHKWKTTGTVTTTCRFTKQLTGYTYLMVCEKCGEHTSEEVRA